MKKGKFIVFEGIDGSGKGTQAKLAVSYIFDMDKKNDVYFTREPTRNTNIIRERMSQAKEVMKNADWYANMFIEDRKGHIKDYITPIIEKGIHIVCDRYKYSTLAYQHAQGMDLNDLIKRHEDMIIPDLTLIFDCPVEIAFERRKKDGATDMFDKDIKFQEILRKHYLSFKKLFPNENIIIIDATKTIEEIKKDVIDQINKLMDISNQII